MAGNKDLTIAKKCAITESISKERPFFVTVMIPLRAISLSISY